ncbi:GvpL/GvpF family gas vesicle protein [Actinoallomurus rhizosphaericola]|uniref:GvpL/GvpF family gas vesicle protein n=1 Tax=Actinoallomurus rhizosphaericola TaxID=2952536 RepID=UPI0020931E0B|nr:GvpL/GvpF family gas vesicle protein [Actinoallomurus rhizosphaericola]MCO5998034.1 GvpL/GvpF family gas vesicle protein [Actinoallomurus rhizosphaericola]
MTDTGTYLYAIARDTGAPPPPGPTGLLGAPVRTIAEAGLVAYVGTVPLAQFGEAALKRNLEDLTWLEATARAHHQVVEAMAEAGPVAPVRLVTVYRGDEQIHRLLRDRAQEFTEVLARVAGRREWGVKVFAAARPAAPDDAGAGEPPESAAERPGTAYLKRRRTNLRTREEAWHRAASRAERIDSVLTGIAVARRHHRAQDPQLSGRDDWMVLNGAYLVEDERGEEFAAAVAALRDPELDVQLTGPWAPYSFTISESGTGGTA